MEHDTYVKTSNRGEGRVVGTPIGHDVALEAELALEQLVQRPVVLARPRRVDLVCAPSSIHTSPVFGERRKGARTVAAHDASDTSLDGAHERVHVDLMLRPVIDVGRLMVAQMFLFTAPHPSSAFPPTLSTLEARTC